MKNLKITIGIVILVLIGLGALVIVLRSPNTGTSQTEERRILKQDFRVY